VTLFPILLKFFNSSQNQSISQAIDHSVDQSIKHI